MSSDMNKMLDNVHRSSKEIEKSLKELMGQYDDLYRESNRQFNQERSIIGSMKGLENFYHLVQTIRRNRDLMGSLLRGINSLRPVLGFKFVEEDVQPRESKKSVVEQVLKEAEIAEEDNG